MTAWWDGSAVPWDIESDSPEPTDARIITSYAGEIRVIDGKAQAAPGSAWLAQPERDIPDEAADVHGITTEHALMYGAPRAEVVEQIARTLAETTKEAGTLAWGKVPVVGHNLAYDLSLLDRELRRLGLGKLTDGYAGDPRVTVILRGEPVGAFYVIDTMVLDKAIDTYRPGPKDPVTGEKLGGRNKLTTVAEFYGVPIRGDAHEASADAMASARIAWAIAKRCAMAAEYYAESQKTWAEMDPEVGREIRDLYRDRRRPAEVIDTLGRVGTLTLAELHAWQKRMAREQAESFRQYCIDNPAYVEEKEIDIGGISGAWPIRPLTDAGETETVATVADGIL